MFRRSDFIEEMYAFSFVLANFGIAMAARMPMITTTINSSMSVKPLRFMQPPAQTVCLWAKTCRDRFRSEEHTSELQSPDHLVCRLLLEKKKKKNIKN